MLWTHFAVFLARNGPCMYSVSWVVKLFNHSVTASLIALRLLTTFVAGAFTLYFSL